jgi:hypothetical protein
MLQERLRLILTLPKSGYPDGTLFILWGTSTGRKRQRNELLTPKVVDVFRLAPVMTAQASLGGRNLSLLARTSIYTSGRCPHPVRRFFGGPKNFDEHK